MSRETLNQEYRARTQLPPGAGFARMGRRAFLVLLYEIARADTEYFRLLAHVYAASLRLHIRNGWKTDRARDLAELLLVNRRHVRATEKEKAQFLGVSERVWHRRWRERYDMLYSVYESWYAAAFREFLTNVSEPKGGQ